MDAEKDVDEFEGYPIKLIFGSHMPGIKPLTVGLNVEGAKRIVASLVRDIVVQTNEDLIDILNDVVGLIAAIPGEIGASN